jgi:hypothetical protein
MTTQPEPANPTAAELHTGGSIATADGAKAAKIKSITDQIGKLVAERDKLMA